MMVTKGEQTSAKIVDVARRLFEQQGYHGTSMRQIAQEAGIALSGIYNHFESKEEIFVKVMENFHPYHEIVPILQAATGDSVEEFVRQVAEGTVTVLDQRPDFMNLVLIELVEFKSKHMPILMELFLPQVLSIIQEFAAMKGNVRPIPLPIIVRVFLANFYAYFLIENFFGDNFPFEMREDAMKHTIDIFLHGILTEE
jgi:AcrR family transcriptional regulator